MPDGNIARRVQKLGQGIVPCLPIGPVDLNVDDVLMVSPGLMQQEPVLVFAIPVQGCVHKGLSCRMASSSAFSNSRKRSRWAGRS